MTTVSHAARAKPAFSLLVLAGLALVACGSLTSSPGDPPGTAADGGTSAEQAGTTSQGGAGSGVGGTSGGVTLVVTMMAGTTSSNTPLQPGAAGEGGQPDYPAVVNLCIYPEDIPDHWGAGGVGGAATDERGCVIGEVGGFNFMGCLYDLLSPTSFPVDIFVGGHSRCCYSARLRACQ